MLKNSGDETITLDVHKKIRKLPYKELAEEYKQILLRKIQETSRFNPTEIQLPLVVPRNECQEHSILCIDEDDLKKDQESTNPSTLARTETDDGSCISNNAVLLRGRVGLDNPGLFCYLNTGIQCLLSMTKFTDCMLKHFQLGNMENKEASLLIVKLIQTFFSLKSGIVKPIPL